MSRTALFFVFLGGAHSLTTNSQPSLDSGPGPKNLVRDGQKDFQYLVTEVSQTAQSVLMSRVVTYLPPGLLPSIVEQLLVWHVVAAANLLMVLFIGIVTRKRRRLQLEDDANVKSGLGLLWALSGKDISTRLSYFTKRKPLDIVVSGTDNMVTVQEFESLTQKAAASLLQVVAKGETLLVVMPRATDFYAVIVACLRAGQLFVPVSPELARDDVQLEKLLAETGATAVITTEALYAESRRGGSSSIKTRKSGGQLMKDLRMILVSDLLETRSKAQSAKETRLRAPKGSEIACKIFASQGSSAPSVVSFSHQNIIGMVDSWLQAGLHSKAVAMSFGDEHTDMTSMSYALGAILSGARLQLSSGNAQPSPKMLETLEVTHGLVGDKAQATFDWSAKSKATLERTLFVTTPLTMFCDDANANGLKVRALYTSPIHVCGISGIATKVTVNRDELIAKGCVKHLSLTQKIKQKAKSGKQVDSLTFVSSGLPHDNVDLMIRRNDESVQDDVVGEILIRSSLQASAKEHTPQGIAGFKSTGDFGFVSSTNYQLYITAGQSDSIMLDKKTVVASELEQMIEKQQPVAKAAMFPIESNDGSSKIVFAAELLDAAAKTKPIIAGLQKFAQAQKLPLGGIVVLSPGAMPMLHGSSVVSRASVKMKYLEGSLAPALDGIWRASDNKTDTAHAVDTNVDDVEAATFAPARSVQEKEGRATRSKEILTSALRELKKMGVNTTPEEKEWLLGSQQMAMAAKRFERMLTTPDDNWAAFGVEGDVAPWGSGVCICKTVTLNAMMFLQTEGNVTKILDILERAKFPSTKDAATIVKSEPKLAAAAYEGEAMNIMTYRALETLGSCFVAFIMGVAVTLAVAYYNWLYTFMPASAFSQTFPMFLNIFTILTVACKWLIIGKYKPAAYARYSSGYFRWWLMDRLIETWEGWVACWFAETIYLNLIYKMFGANIDWSTNMASFIREFDLIEIGADADISGELFPRIVTKDGVIMHKIFVGEAAKIDSKGYLAPNTTVEAGATVDKCEVVKSGATVKAPEVGARVANRAAGIRLEILQWVVQLVGGMAFMGKFISPHATALATTVRMYSPLWLALGANANLEGPIPIDALRWTTYYMVFLWTLGFLLTAWTVIMKWCLFGRLKDGHRTGGLWWDLRVYMLNWWWMLANMFFITYWVDCSLLSITMYRLFGANVSYRTGLRFMQNMSPHHADFITIKDGCNMSNAKCHPSTAADRNILKNIVLEEGAFVGLMSIVQGGVTVGKNSSVATTTRCVSSVAPGTNLIGTMAQKQKATKEIEMDFSQISFSFYAKDLGIALVLKAVLMVGYVLGVSCTVATAMYAYELGLPMPFVIVVAVLGLAFFLGVLYGKVIEVLLHPRCEAELEMSDPRTQLWLQYLQGLFLSQNYTFSMLNGSWMAAWFHRMLGADTPLDAQWYTLTIRDQCLLTVGHDAVIDRDAYMVGHVGQPGGVLSFQRASLGDGAQLHPKSILLSGQRLEDNATLDFYSHSHLEKSVPEGKFYSGNPATALKNCRVDEIYAGFPKKEEK